MHPLSTAALATMRKPELKSTMSGSTTTGPPPSYDVATSEETPLTGPPRNGYISTLSYAGPSASPNANVGALNALPDSLPLNPPAFSPYDGRTSSRLPRPGSQFYKSQQPITSAPHASTPRYGPQTLYHYQDPETGRLITSPLPPTHPAMICLQEGGHIPGSTHWGILGLLSAIVFFPIGVLCCFIDREVHCIRCGEIIHSGLST